MVLLARAAALAAVANRANGGKTVMEDGGRCLGRRFRGRLDFICPGIANAVACCQRVTKLYGAGIYFLCRHCYRLGYASHREDRYHCALRARRTKSACASTGSRA
jgi:hypothetical protein